MAIKNVVIPLEVEYLQAAAKNRVSRTVRAVTQKVVRDQLVADLLESRIWLSIFNRDIGGSPIRGPANFAGTVYPRFAF